jgi:hypothetical protein
MEPGKAVEVAADWGKWAGLLEKLSRVRTASFISVKIQYFSLLDCFFPQNFWYKYALHSQDHNGLLFAPWHHWILEGIDIYLPDS